MIEIIPFEEGNILGLHLNGRIDDLEFDEIVAKIEEILDDNEKIRIYAEIDKIGGMSVNTFMKNIHLKLTHWKDVEKEAIVTDKNWLESWIGIADKLFPGIEIKHFNPDDKKAAKEWITK